MSLTQVLAAVKKQSRPGALCLCFLKGGPSLERLLVPHARRHGPAGHMRCRLSFLELLQLVEGGLPLACVGPDVSRCRAKGAQTPAAPFRLHDNLAGALKPWSRRALEGIMPGRSACDWTSTSRAEFRQLESACKLG